jgi:hypothetical protein
MKLIISFRFRWAGSNSIKNLWPESYRTVWDARVKDRLEDRLHALVISRKLNLETATARDRNRLDRRLQAIYRPLPRLRPSPCLFQSGRERLGTNRFARRSRGNRS